eukprot:13481369-Alexandrium_andersonii.AAC.1
MGRGNCWSSKYPQSVFGACREDRAVAAYADASAQQFGNPQRTEKLHCARATTWAMHMYASDLRGRDEGCRLPCPGMNKCKAEQGCVPERVDKRR